MNRFIIYANKYNNKKEIVNMCSKEVGEIDSCNFYSIDNDKIAGYIKLKNIQIDYVEKFKQRLDERSFNSQDIDTIDFVISTNDNIFDNLRIRLHNINFLSQNNDIIPWYFNLTEKEFSFIADFVSFHKFGEVN